jgi:Family of unknown function (DUF6159)
MNWFGRVQIGWALTKGSLRVLDERPHLIVLPAAGATLATLATVAVTFPGLYLLGSDYAVAGLAVVALGYFLASLASTFFGVALARAADAAFSGDELPIRDALAAARSRTTAILGWATLSATVGTLVAVFKSQRLVGPLVGRLTELAWGLLVFVAVPVIAIEGTGPLKTLKRSAVLFRTPSPSQFGGNLVVSTVLGIFVHIPAYFLVLVGGGTASMSIDDGDVVSAVFFGLVGVAGVALFCASIVLTQALRQLFGVALYRYLASGDIVGGFTESELRAFDHGPPLRDDGSSTVRAAV